MAKTDENSHVATLIKEGMEAAGLDKAEVARHLGVSYTAVHNWETGKNRPGIKKAREIAELLGINPTHLIAAITGSSDAGELPRVDYRTTLLQTDGSEPAIAVSTSNLGALNVPVYGVAVGGDDADFYLNGQITHHVRKPPAIENLNDVYALYVVGHSMSPRFRDGDLVYVHRRVPGVGDDVVIQLKPGEDGGERPGFIKYLIRRTPTLFVCGQYNPAVEIEYAREAVLSMDRVIPWKELLGI